MTRASPTPAFQPSVGPGPTSSTIICWVIIAGFVTFMFWSQSRQARLAAIAATTSLTQQNLGLELTGRLAVAQAQLLGNDHSPQAKTSQDNLKKQLLQNINTLALSPLDKLKSVVITRELQGDQAALVELNQQYPLLIHYPRLSGDCTALRNIYTTGPLTLTADERDRLIQDLGWFGELAVTQGQSANNPGRAAILHAAQHSMLQMVGIAMALLGAVFIGFLLLILAIVLFALGKIRCNFRPVEPQLRPVYLETFALWGLGFLLLIFTVQRWKSDRHLVVFELCFLILSMLIALWPLLRGVSWRQLRQALGWYRGKGIIPEISAGLLGYLAGLPIIAIGVVTTLILSRVAHVNPTHPIQQEFSGPLPPAKLLGLSVTISVAAPLLEETMFRGALYGHLRQRWWPWLSAVIVSLLFAAIHPQGWAGIPVLASIAIVLAFLREWRGSLIASITAHGINNALVLLFIVLVLK